MKIDIGLLVVFFLLGAVSSVIPVLGPMFAATIGSYHLLEKESFPMAFYSYLTFMIGTGFVTSFLWLSEVREFSGFDLFIVCFIVSVAFLAGPQKRASL